MNEKDPDDLVDRTRGTAKDRWEVLIEIVEGPLTKTPNKAHLRYQLP